ncbi:MAG: YqgE/AlgH family protein [Cytophagaceae bacterium]|nr:YqgE/AlgH family protein [Cytophagaceae bacterium]
MIKSGDILIAEPYLEDETFDRSVVLIGNHTHEGTFGFVLNKPSDLIISDVIEDLSSFSLPIYIGGPVEQDTLHFIYRNPLPLEGTVQLTQNLFWGGDFEKLKEMLNNQEVSPDDVRFFVGYSGWAEGQLDDELTKKSWITWTPSVDDIFDLPFREMWRNILKKMGGRYKILANYPSDPRLN